MESQTLGYTMHRKYSQSAGLSKLVSFCLAFSRETSLQSSPHAGYQIASVWGQEARFWVPI